MSEILDMLEGFGGKLSLDDILNQDLNIILELLKARNIKVSSSANRK